MFHSEWKYHVHNSNSEAIRYPGKTELPTESRTWAQVESGCLQALLSSPRPAVLKFGLHTAYTYKNDCESQKTFFNVDYIRYLEY